MSEDKKDSPVPPAGDVFPPSADGEIPCRAKGAALIKSAAKGGTSLAREAGEPAAQIVKKGEGKRDGAPAARTVK